MAAPSSPKSQAHKFQPPKGTRDFYPADMALRRHIEGVWERSSACHGFEEIDGPTFEHLELYTVKSGPGIVSELFSFRRSGGDTDYALRPEFTPTLARMYAAKANTLAKPTKWFCIPSHFRAERPQRGRLREFAQWNADMIGDATPRAEAEIIAVTVEVLRGLGLTSSNVRVKINHRKVISTILLRAGFAESNLPSVYDLLDRRDKLSRDDLLARARQLGLDSADVDRFERLAAESVAGPEAMPKLLESFGVTEEESRPIDELIATLREIGLDEWCELDLGIVRGLAYYTGTVFEVHEATGRERAIAGGGRYDELIELFGGPPTPAVGIAMGDVVLRLVLEDAGLLQPAETYQTGPDVFVVSGREDGDARLRVIVADLRRGGWVVRHSYRATRNVGKLLGEAGKARARFAVILGKELDAGNVVLKDLEGGGQREVAPADLDAVLEEALHGALEEGLDDEAG